MNKELYIGIRDRILLKVPEITHVKLYNNQFERSNNDSVEQNIEQPFPYPCAFIEFADINFSELTFGLQDYELTIRIYIGFESYTLEDTYVFDLKQKVYRALQYFQVSSPTQTYGKIMRTLEQQDTDRNNVYIYIQEYKMRARDCDFEINEDSVLVNPVTPEINADLKINNIVIRTGII